VASSAPTVSSLADGSTVYSYTLPKDGTVTLIDPPAGFDFTDATPSELRQYGLPPEPPTPDISAVESWESTLEGLQTPQPAPPFLIQSPYSAGVIYSNNWSGYIVFPSFGVGGAEVTYVEPSVSSCTSGSADLFWAGLGGWLNNYLGQDGTSWFDGGSNNYEAWEEVLPNQPSLVDLGFTIPAGHGVEAEVSWTPSSQSYDGFVDDTTNGNYQIWGFVGASAPGNSAEAVAERPSVDGSLTPLADFSSVRFESSTASSTSGQSEPFSSFSPNGSRDGLYMTTNGQSTGSLLAKPGAIGSGGSFTDDWDGCG